MRSLLLLTSLYLSLIQTQVGFSQDAFRSDQGWGTGWGNNDTGTNETWGGSTWDYVNSWGGATDRFFRFYTNGGGCLQEWGPATDLEMTPGISLNLTAGNSAAYFTHVENTSWHYIFRTRNSTQCATPEAVYFEIQGSVRTISSVAQSPSSVFPGQDVEVSATISNSSNLGQGYYIRYTDDGFTTSTVVELSGGGTSYSATIPGSVNTGSANISYYVFSSGSGLTIVPADVDFFTFSLNNNSNSNYNYAVASEWVSTSSGDWETATTWTANAVPGAGQPVHIAAHTVTTTASSNISGSSIEIDAGGSLDLGTSSTMTLTEFNGITGDGDLTSGLNSILKVPLGGYLSGGGTKQVYDLEIGENAGSGNHIFYLNSNLEISHDLHIEENGELHPGNGSSVVVELSGASGNIYNDGLLKSTPDLGDVNNERLAFLFSGQTTLRGNGDLSGDRTRFSDITINGGSSVVSDAAGTLNAELQFGTLINNGSFNMGQTATGKVNLTLRGTAGNNYFIYSDNADQTFQFSDLTIGSNGSNDGAHLQLTPGSENIVVQISGDFQNYYKFSPINTDPATINIIMNGLVDQAILGKTGQTDGNKTTFNKLEIANSSGNVYLASIGPDVDADNNVSYEIEDALTLTSGKLISLNGGNRHHLILTENATIISAGAQSDEDGQPCYIEGPLVWKAGVGTNTALPFPIGQGEDFRNLEIETDISTGPVQFTVEHFSYSANFNGMTVAAPITNISDVRFWNIKIDLPANVSNTDFTIDYGDTDTDGVTYEDDLRVVWAEQDASTDGDASNDDWTGIGSSGGSSQMITSGSFSFSGEGVDKIDITLGNVGIGVNPLPVTWLDISCAVLLGRNLIEWATASETNASHFIVERASSNFDFTEIGRLDAQGWSNQKTEYAFSDSETFQGLTYYRIRQVDFDGVFDFSEIVSASINSQGIAYPNPFRERIYIDSNILMLESLLEVFNSTGALFYKEMVGEDQIIVQNTDWPTGIYVVKVVQTNGNPLSFKMIKTK